MNKTYACLLAVVLFGPPLLADEWPQWQGPDRNSVSKEKGLLQQWPEHGPPLAWRTDGLGGGDSAPAIVGGKIYGMSNRDGKEIVWALSETSGKEIWATPLGDAVEQRMSQSKEGPGGTPTVVGEQLYVIDKSEGQALIMVFCSWEHIANYNGAKPTEHQGPPLCSLIARL